MYEELLPDWFPEVSDGEMVYVRRDPRTTSGEKWSPMTVHRCYRSEERPNLDVIRNGTRELIQNVLHVNDPRLSDASFMANATHPDAPGVGGVFVINPTRAAQEGAVAELHEELAKVRSELHSLKISVGRQRAKHSEPAGEQAAA